MSGGVFYNVATRKPWRASDISDEEFMAAVEEISRSKDGEWVYWWDLRALPAYAGVPTKVLRAKAARLIRRGLMDGCTCGCRGDLVVLSIGNASHA